MKLTDQEMLAIGSGILVLLVWQARRAYAPINPKQNPDSWFDDMWARLNGRDLSINGDHPAPGPYDVYGMSNEMGWNYSWDGSVSGMRVNPLSLADSNALKAAYV